MDKDKLIDDMKKLIRFQYLTLGYYATEYNYKELIYNPISGITQTGITEDNGFQAKKAIELAKQLNLVPEGLK